MLVDFRVLVTDQYIADLASECECVSVKIKLCVCVCVRTDMHVCVRTDMHVCPRTCERV